jgi:hypothetical protein
MVRCCTAHYRVAERKTEVNENDRHFPPHYSAGYKSQELTYIKKEAHSRIPFSANMDIVQPDSELFNYSLCVSVIFLLVYISGSL